MNTLVCFALKEEAGAFRKRVPARPDVAILLTGIGQKNAAASVSDILTRHMPTVVLTCGFAGGLNATLQIGDIVFSTSDHALRDKLVAAGAKPAKIHSATRVAITVAEKQALRQYTGADAVEMESEIIQKICLEQKIACATVRAISDTAGEDLPLDFNKLSKPDLNLDFRKLAVELLKRPGKIPALLRLQKNCGVAARQLAKVLERVVGKS